MAKFLVCNSKELPEGKMLNTTAGGKEILVAKVDGKYYSVSNICTHAGAELHEGEINGEEIKCPWHGAKWDIKTGNLLWFPQKLKPLESLKVIEEEGRIYLEI